MLSSIAAAPSSVPGILMNRLFTLARWYSAVASATVLAASCASRGDTSKDTQPSDPPLA